MNAIQTKIHLLVESNRYGIEPDVMVLCANNDQMAQDLFDQKRREVLHKNGYLWAETMTDWQLNQTWDFWLAESPDNLLYLKTLEVPELLPINC